MKMTRDLFQRIPTFWLQNRSVAAELRGQIIGVTLRDRQQASDIRKQTQVDDFMAQAKRKKWTWAGYGKRRTDKTNGRTTRKTGFLPTDWIRSRGEPMNSIER